MPARHYISGCGRRAKERDVSGLKMPIASLESRLPNMMMPPILHDFANFPMAQCDTSRVYFESDELPQQKVSAPPRLSKCFITYAQMVIYYFHALRDDTA